jgi:hypothetical protein
MPQNPKQSPVIQFITLAWQNATKGVPFSYERINHTMSRAMSVALGAFEFGLNDYAVIANGEFGACHWLDTENCYTAAVVNGNTSACLSIEKHLGREPIIADNVDPPKYGDRNTHLVGKRQRERLHVGARFPWKGETVTVTSIGTDSATACSYRKRKDGATDEEFGVWLIRRDVDQCKLPPKVAKLLRSMCDDQSHDYSAKVLHRYTITREAVIADRAKRKRRQEILDRLADVRETDLDGPVEALKAIGVVTSADFDKAPLKKLEKVLAKFAEKTA